MRRWRWVVIGVGILAVVCLAVVVLLVPRGLGSLAERDHPLVLIHTPRNLQRVELGQGVSLHATARSRAGVTRIEFWADGQLISSRQTEGGESSSPAVLAAGWEPTTLGAHHLVVRAVSASGVSGQASVTVESAPAPALEDEETPGGEPAAVLEETDLLPAEGAYPAAAAEGAPLWSDEPPGSAGEVLEYAGLTPLIPAFPYEAETIGLRVELLSLHTDVVYEGLHCYVGLGGSPPRWVPDEDADPATDESFFHLGGGYWDVASHLAGERAPVLEWPSGQLVAVDIACVGVSGGGTEALDLGHQTLSVDPELWDGVTRRIEVEGPEGGFAFEYRIGPADESPGWAFTDLDLNMTPPVNLRIDTRRSRLLWDYTPRPDEEPIQGFRVFLNGAMQWVEASSERETGLPYEWLFPPCDQQYAIFVDANRGEAWSMPSNFLMIPQEGPNEDNCERTVIVTLDTLTTRHLGGDEDHAGWGGAVYGSFYVNDQRVSFDGRCGRGEVCGIIGLDHYTDYDLGALMDDMGADPPQLLVHLQPDETLTVGFDINDQDSGPSRDDPVCSGEDYPSDAVNRAVESSTESDDARCVLSYTARPAFGSAVEGIEGAPPRPMLRVENLTVDPETPQLRVQVRNVGAGTWPEHDLVVSLAWSSGEAIGEYTFPDFFLAPGDRAVLQRPDMAPGPQSALGACVLLDAANEVPEEEDDLPSLARGEYCRPRPDLAITNVNYDREAERLLVTVYNGGEGSMEDSDLSLLILLAGGETSEALLQHRWPDTSIAAGEHAVLEWPDVAGEAREGLLGGYTVVLDPENQIAEQNEDNNQFTVAIADGTHVELGWGRVYVPHYSGYGTTRTNADNFSLRAEIVDWTTGRVRMTPADWSTGSGDYCRIRNGEEYWGPGGRHGNCHAHSDRVELYLGPEHSIVVTVTGSLAFVSDSPLGGGSLSDHSLGEGRLVIEADAWATAPLCSSYDRQSHEIWVNPPDELYGPAWFTVVEVCRAAE